MQDFKNVKLSFDKARTMSGQEIKEELKVENVEVIDYIQNDKGETVEDKNTLTFIYKPRMKGSEKDALRTLASESFMSQDDEETDDEKFDVFKKGLKDAVEAMSEFPKMARLQEEGSQKVFNALVKLHWNTETFIQTGGMKGDFWQAKSQQPVNPGDLDSEVLDALRNPLAIYNTLGVKKK